MYTLDHNHCQIHSNNIHMAFFRNMLRGVYAQKIALRSDYMCWSYGHLLIRIEEIAGALDRSGVKKGDVIALAAARSFENIAAVYAIMSLGAVYLPIDRQFPSDRVAYMLGLSGCRLIVTDDPAQYEAHRMTCQILTLGSLNGPRKHCDQNIVAGDDLAYILFTSGTTGRPKGVMVSHGSGARLLDWAVSRFSPEDLRCVLGATSFAFDMSIFEVFAPLAAGGSLYLVDSIVSLADLPRSAGVTLINAVPSALAALSKFKLPLGQIRVCLLAGEQVHAPLVRCLYEAGVERVYNLYGPTEDTVYSTEYLIDRSVPEDIPIGRPLPGHDFLIVDENLTPAPPGSSGELCLMGVGLANGYVARPNLTTERFTRVKVGPHRGRIMYRTGDFVRLGSDGLLYYLGRLDNQIKLRGHRIELDEITRVISSVQHVARATVQIQSIKGHEGDRLDILVGYVALHPACRDTTVAFDRIRETIARRLPRYMHPDRLSLLDSFPLSSTGKINVSCIPAFDC